MTTVTRQDVTTQVYRVYIRAAPEKIWDAITKPEWNARYGYRALGEYDLRPGGAYRSTPSDEMRKYATEQGFPMPDVIVDGEVLESDPPAQQRGHLFGSALVAGDPDQGLQTPAARAARPGRPAAVRPRPAAPAGSCRCHPPRSTSSVRSAILY